jgi:hypothetical protein
MGLGHDAGQAPTTGSADILVGPSADREVGGTSGSGVGARHFAVGQDQPAQALECGPGRGPDGPRPVENA